MATQFDYIIIGAGSAGCVLANRLSEDRTRTVLVLEAGGSDRSPYVRIPSGMQRIDKKLDWRYEGEPDASRHGMVDFWAAGKVLGGSSSINGMIWVRGNDADYDGWAAQGCDGWDSTSVLPYFRRAETYRDATSEYRGTAGPLHVEQVRVSHELTEAFIEAAQQAGHPFNPDYNGAEQPGVTRGQLSQRRGWRQSCAVTYLAKARRRKNVTLLTGATVHRVVIDGGRATGVTYERNGKVDHAACRGEVLLSAGALSSPKLLMLSGVGPADHLREMGIPVVVDAPGVGQNLQDHPGTPMQFGVNVRTINQELNLKGVLKHGLDFVLRGRGAATSGFGSSLLFGSTEAGSLTDYEIIFMPFAIAGDAPAEEDDAGSVFNQIESKKSTYKHDVHDMTILKTASINLFPGFLHPHGRGTLTLRSARPEDRPRIHFQLLGDDRDMLGLISACRVARDVLTQPAMKKYVLDEELPGAHVQTDDEWREHLHNVSFREEHPVGTCRMGSDDAAPLDPSLRVRGVEGLRVVDASVMPCLTTGNTNAPVIMIGEKGADLVRGTRV